MAKADFCFNFYDGDAARDMAHMNRLERGAYMDVMIQQRQRGHLSTEDLKKFLSRDFDAVWQALEWVLKKDHDGKFFIEWLEASELRSKTHSKLQKERRSGKPKSNPVTPKIKSGQPPVEPVGYGDGYGDESVIEIGNVGENSVVIRAKYAGEKPRRIYDLAEYFKRQGQLGELTQVGWNAKFTSFMRDNPGRVFDDDNHLYNSLKQFKNNDRHTGKGKVNGTPGATFSGDYSQPV